MRALTYRITGSLSEAEDAVQEAWIRLSRSDSESIENLRAWLTRVTGRICLDMLRTRRSGGGPADAAAAISQERVADSDPEAEAIMADSVGLALLVVLERLTPDERVAFVLHDLFDVPFDEIGRVIDRNPVAARQLASRARRRVVIEPDEIPQDRARQRAIVDAFLQASRDGAFGTLLSILKPDVVLDGGILQALDGSRLQLEGASDVAGFFAGRAASARCVAVDGRVGVVVAPCGKVLMVLRITLEGEQIARIEAVSDRTKIDRLDLQPSLTHLLDEHLAYTIAVERIRAMPVEVKRLAQMLIDAPEVVDADCVTGEDRFLAKVVVCDVHELETVIDHFLPFHRPTRPSSNPLRTSDASPRYRTSGLALRRRGHLSVCLPFVF